MEADLRKQLSDLLPTMRYRSDQEKATWRNIYRVAMKAIERCEGLRAELDRLSQPELFRAGPEAPPTAQSSSEPENTPYDRSDAYWQGLMNHVDSGS